MNQPQISVIIPVYNTEKYLERCVLSVTAQSYRNLEIILVDDGSNDRSLDLCNELAKTDKRIKVVHKENGGLSSARNAGIDVANAEYIAFVDSDDWISQEIYQKCVDIINKTQSDIVDFRPVYVYGDDLKNRHIDNQSDSEVIVVSGEENILYDYLYRGQTENCPFSVCRKLYRRELFDGIRFPVGRINEDIVTNYRVLARCRKLSHISDIGYFYFQDNNKSITTGRLRRSDFDLIDASNELCDLSKSLYDKRINKLAKVKLARSYFSLLAKAAIGGTSDEISHKEIAQLTSSLRDNYLFLMKSPMPINRKVLVTVVAIDYRIIAMPYRVLKRVKSVFK